MVFESFNRNSRKDSIYLGSPEAEADANPNSRIPLSEVYEDYHQLVPQLIHEKFIIVGRKGSGKSAFAEYVWLESTKQPNLFCTFIKKSELSLERIVQIGESEGIAVDSEALFKWLIYTKILQLFAFNESISVNKDYELLRKFLKKNSGYIDIKEYEIKDLVKKQGFDINIEYLKRFFSGKFNSQIEEKSSKAKYYKLLPHLEEIIVKVMSSNEEKENGNSYVLFFDDLDIDFSTSNKFSCDSLVNLVRVCRHVNNDIFGKNGLKAKAIILIRDDIESFLSSRYADTSKIFSSYSAKINWYQDDNIQGKSENELNIKKFINKRILYAFNKNSKNVDISDPWKSLVKENDNDKSTFKSILNNTLFRPRDLLLLFKPIENGAYKFPLSGQEVGALIKSYASELAKELKNELSSFYNSTQIENIFSALGELSQNSKSYSEAIELFRDYCKGVEPSEIIEYLFDRSVIGNVDQKGWYTFKCREPISSPEPYRLNWDQNIVVQYGIRNYVYQKGY